MPEEMVEAPGLVAPKKEAEEARRVLRRIDALSSDLSPLKMGEEIVFPLRSGPSLDEARRILGGRFIIRQFNFPRTRRRPRSIKEAISDYVPPSLLERLPSSFDVIGDIAVVELREELREYGAEIARGIMLVNPSVKTVLAEAGPISGEFRIREYIHLAGERKTSTIHKENRCIFKVDLARVYFNPRLATERLRVASQVQRGELVIDMFAGVGPFSIEIARLRGARVIAVEINPDAYEFLKMNIRRNGVEGLVTPLLGDAAVVLADKSGVADRVIMNNPTRSLDFLSTALAVAKRGAVLHVYGFAEDEPSWQAEVAMRLSSMGARLEGLSARRVGDVAPGRQLVVVDAPLA